MAKKVDMEKPLIARRQKDLEGYVTQLQTELDKVAATHMKNMAPLYKNIQLQLVNKIKAIYKQAGAEENLNKATALMNKAKRLEALASQMTADLGTAAQKLQPYYTGALTDMYERSYYLTGFGLSQAARVGVTLPLLTPMSVLGAVANPWVGDGANYSSRLRATTAYLAVNMRMTVQQAVVEGWGVAEAARAIEEQCKEGYHNSVRLIRTELNRAASQGASYAYMQNADILDGKRWNATLDSRTAAKDANNDGKLYDLDYDTMENPGVAGQRIPNHPNCRCSWTPVLSALGVSKKERIARRGDSKDSYGENYKTAARTYREYAKERGLPDLDARLKKDNLKSYLRPGETIADLNKKVVPWKAKGGTVSVPKPYWEATKKAAPKRTKVAVDPIAEARKELETLYPLRYFDNNKDAAEAFYSGMSEAPIEFREYMKKYSGMGLTRIDGVNSTGTSHYRPSDNAVHLDKGDWAAYKKPKTEKVRQSADNTLFHEIGHGLDYGHFRTTGGDRYSGMSEGNGFSDAMEEAKALYKHMKKESMLSTRNLKSASTIAKYNQRIKEADAWLHTFHNDMNDNYKAYGYVNGSLIHNVRFEGLSDIMNGITDGTFSMGFGHAKTYWQRAGAAQKEAFANLYSMHIMGYDDAIGAVKKYFPNVLSEFIKMVKDV